MQQYEIEGNLANFIRREIAKEVRKAKSLEYPIDFTVDRIFSLVAMAASKARPSELKPLPPKNQILIE
jgi:hypothetical protein